MGPTASGKSALGVRLARRFGGEVLACDSTQVYRGFDIGTAKPTLEEREGVPHHLLDLVDPDFPFTAGEYRARAIAVLEDLRQRVAASDSYRRDRALSARAAGRAWPTPRRVRRNCARAWKPRADAHSLQYLHRVLRRLDPEAAVRIGRATAPR